MHKCSECDNEIAGRAKTCGDACRAKRHRRLQRRDAPGAEVERSTLDQAVERAVAEQITPIVREAMTEDVLRAIQSLVKLTPEAIAAIERDLSSDNDFIRQGAYRLVARYTLGHAALVPELESDKQVVVLVDGVARPQGPAQASEQLAAPHPHEADAEGYVETRVCDTCNEEKPVGEFVGASHRCADCFTRARDHAYSIGPKS